MNTCLRIIYRTETFYESLIRRIKIGPNKYRVEGVLIDLLKSFASNSNICYNLTHHDSAIPWGHLDPVNKTFVGSLASLQKNDSDILLFLMRATKDRNDYFDISTYFTMSSLSALMKFPEVKPNYAGFAQIFDYISWTVIGFMLLMGIIMMLFLNTKAKISHRKRDTKYGKDDFTSIFVDVFSLILGTLLAQGFTRKRIRNISSEVFVCMCLLSFLFLSFFYKSTLLAILMIPKMTVPFRNVHEMVQQDEVKWVIRNGNAYYSQLEREKPNTVFGRLFAKSIKSGNNFGNEEQIQGVRNGKLSLLIPEGAMYLIMSHFLVQEKSCSFTIMKENFWSSSYHFIFRKGLNATIKNRFDQTILRLHQSGIIRFQIQSYWDHRTFICISESRKRRSHLRQLEIEDFYGVFGLWFLGCSFAAIVFALEYVTYKLRKERTSRRRNEPRY